MSYILDALRRADAERDRGSVPGLHAQPAALGELDVEAPRTARSVLWAVVAALVVMTAAAAWWMLGSTEPPRIASGAGQVAPPAADTSLPPAAAALAAAPVAAASKALPPTAAAVAPPARPVPAEPPSVMRKPASKLAESAPARGVPASAGSVRPSAPPEATPPATDPRVYQLSELPDDIRRELPTLAIGGAMYSPNPANRMLIVNGQTFHEGDKLAPGLSLEQIRLKSALLEYKGYRYRITY